MTLPTLEERIAQIKQALRWSLNELEFLDRATHEELSHETLSLVRRALSQFELFEVTVDWKQKQHEEKFK